VHHSLTGFVLPSLLPQISGDLNLDDTQVSLLTLGYTALYGLALLPVGRLTDEVDRPALLVAGLLGWSVATMAAGQADTFTGLLAARALFAVAEAVQNPVCFSLIPEFFPDNKSTAMSVYNTAVQLGRSLAFGVGYLSVVLAGMDKERLELVPLQDLGDLDLSLVTILYTTGEKAAIAPVFSYNFDEIGADGRWRDILVWIGLPGFAVAALVLLLVADPDPCRDRGEAFRDFIDDLGGGRGAEGLLELPRRALDSASELVGRLRPEAPSLDEYKLLDYSGAEACPAPDEDESPWDSAQFRLLTAAATFQDLGLWALVTWQPLFYERVFNVESQVYSPWLAVAVPIGGILGGIGGGVASDWLRRRLGDREASYLMGATSLASVPLMAACTLAGSFKLSIALLTLGIAFSEAWRAPSAVLVRETVSPSKASVAIAQHLCVRNLIGGLGPLGVASLAEPYGLQKGMLLIPAFYMCSTAAFFIFSATSGDEGPGDLDVAR
jgi:MFS family permease